MYFVVSVLMAVIIQSKQLYIKPVYSTAVHKPVYSTAVHKPVYSTAAHKTSLQISCTQSQFAEQLYTKLVYSIGILKTSLQHKCTQYSFQ